MGLKIETFQSVLPLITHKGIFNRDPAVFFFFFFLFPEEWKSHSLTCNVTTPLDNSHIKKKLAM